MLAAEYRQAIPARPNGSRDWPERTIREFTRLAKASRAPPRPAPSLPIRNLKLTILAAPSAEAKAYAALLHDVQELLLLDCLVRI